MYIDEISQEAFLDEIEKIALTASDVGNFLTRHPIGGAALGAVGGAGIGAGVGALTGEKGERKKRALIGAGLGAGIGGLGGAAVGAARQLPAKRVLQAPSQMQSASQYSMPKAEALAKTLQEAPKPKAPAATKQLRGLARQAARPTRDLRMRLSDMQRPSRGGRGASALIQRAIEQSRPVRGPRS